MDIHVMLNPDSSDERPIKEKQAAPQHETILSATRSAKPPLRQRRSDRRKPGKRRARDTSMDRGRRKHKHEDLARDRQRRHKKTASLSSTSSSGTSAVRLLLSQARETIQNDPGSRPHGRKPFIMDVILDSLPPPTEFREDILMEALERSERSVLPPPRWTYAFKDKGSLDAYWADQEAIWKGGLHLPSRPLTQTQVSAERSTALWARTSDSSSDSERNI